MQLRLKELRLNKGLTQAQVADAINISAANYSRYESNINEPPLAIICKLADFFNCSVDYILNRTEYTETTNNIIKSVNDVISNANKQIDYFETKIAELDYFANQSKEQLYFSINSKIQELDININKCLDKIKELDELKNFQSYEFKKFLNDAIKKIDELQNFYLKNFQS